MARTKQVLGRKHPTTSAKRPTKRLASNKSTGSKSNDKLRVASGPGPSKKGRRTKPGTASRRRIRKFLRHGMNKEHIMSRVDSARCFLLADALERPGSDAMRMTKSVISVGQTVVTQVLGSIIVDAQDRRQVAKRMTLSENDIIGAFLGWAKYQDGHFVSSVMKLAMETASTPGSKRFMKAWNTYVSKLGQRSDMNMVASRIEQQNGRPAVGACCANIAMFERRFYE